MKQYLAVDIGGTSMKYAAVDDQGELRRLGTVPTGSGMTRAGLETALLQAVRAVQGPLDGVGISTLGTVDSAAGRVLGGEESILVEASLGAVTQNAALQYGLERELGTLRPGKRADFVLLSGDPLRTPPEELKKLQVERTVQRGRTIWSR